ncbi:MAG: NAD(P)/FAD-dependent oxidoreductase [Deltaproteobacteria bacterium]|nr:NAD(P)/FAD-dependent oxidoreductase [Candidatus Zymogenaceae bacterium]
MHKPYVDVAVIGAGPGGIGAGLGALSEGARVEVIEAQDDVGRVKKGETIHFNREMEDILGDSFFSRHEINRVDRRRYYSSTDRYYIDKSSSDPNIIFSWSDFMSDMTDIARKKGLSITTETRVIDLIREGENVRGIIVQNGGGPERITSPVVIGADGCNGITGDIVGIDRTNINLPAIKYLMSGVSMPDNRLEFFFHIYRDEPIGMGFLFPRTQDLAEAGLLVFTNYMKDSTGAYDQHYMARLFDSFASFHPVFTERIRDARPVYSLSTSIPMGGFVPRFVPFPGLVLTGDAAGQVEQKGGCGIVSSFLIGYHTGRLAARFAKERAEWTEQTMHTMESSIRSHESVRAIASYQRAVGRVRSILFRLNDAQRLDTVFSVLARLTGTEQ